MEYDRRTFATKKQIGKLGEQFTTRLASSAGYEVEDVSNQYELGYDLIARKDGKELHLEVKTDNRMWETKNLCLEAITNVEKRKKGWFKTMADDTYICFFDAKNELLHCYLAKDLWDYVNNNPVRYRETYEYEGDYLKSAQIILVDMRNIRHRTFNWFNEMEGEFL